MKIIAANTCARARDKHRSAAPSACVGRRRAQGGCPDRSILSASRRAQAGQRAACSRHGFLDGARHRQRGDLGRQVSRFQYRRRTTKTSQWHFVDIEITAPNLDAACFNHPPIPSGTGASDGPPADCVGDKIEGFAAELANSATDSEEQLVALKFLLHFVGDIHQPLHSSDDNDRGGNNKKVSATGFRAGNLHHFWDTEFVDQLETNPQSITSDLIGHISRDQISTWQAGSPTDWAQESFKVAKADAYGLLPEPSSRGSYRLTDEYITTATDDVAQQLSKAGVRLAFVLNNALRKQ